MTRLEITKTKTTEKIRLTLIMIGARPEIADQIAGIVSSAMDTGHAIGYAEGYREAGDYMREKHLAKVIPIENL